MEYKVSVTGAEFYAYHGCYDLEQMVGNRFRVDVEIGCRLSDVSSDNVEQMVSYLDVYKVIEEQIYHTQRTIERVALNIIEALKDGDQRILSVKCRVAKLAPPLGGKVESASVEFYL